MTEPIIKIYGERNTGTNYLQQLIDLNLDTVLLPGSVPRYIVRVQRVIPGNELVKDLYFHFTFSRNLGWKHVMVPSADALREMTICSKSILFITITKNPYSWLLSLYKRPYHVMEKAIRDFEDFLTSPWKPLWRENAPEGFANPIDMWNRKNASYLQLNARFPTINLKYEELLADPAAIFAQIAEHFSIQKKVQEFQNIEGSSKGDKKDFAFYQSYYLEERWKKELSRKAISIINTHLDRSIMGHFHYEELGVVNE